MGLPPARAFGSLAYAAQQAARFTAFLCSDNGQMCNVFTIRCSVDGGSCIGASDAQPVHLSSQGGNPQLAQNRSGLVIDGNGVSLTASFAAFFGGTIIEVKNTSFPMGVSV